jgi:hypothetical protein
MVSGSFFGTANHGNFGAGRIYNALDNLFQPLRHFATVGNFAAFYATDLSKFITDTSVPAEDANRSIIFSS